MKTDNRGYPLPHSELLDVSYDNIVTSLKMIDVDITSVLSTSETSVLYAPDVEDKDFVYKDPTDNVYKKAIASDPEKCVNVGIIDTDSASVIYSGKVSIKEIGYTVNAPVYLSNSSPGTSSLSPSSAFLGYYIGNGYIHLIPADKRSVGLSEVKNVDTTDAGNITSGILDEGRIPNSITRNNEVNPATRAIINEVFNRNIIINGGMNIAQRGTTQNVSGFGSLDRWGFFANGTTFITTQLERESGDGFLPSTLTHKVKIDVSSVTGNNNYCYMSYKVPYVKQLHDRKVTISFYAKANDSKNISIALYQNFGAGGNADVGVGSEIFSLSTVWNRFSKTINLPAAYDKITGTTIDYTEIRFWFDAGSMHHVNSGGIGHKSGTYEITGVLLDFGDEVRDFPYISFMEELDRCLAYFHKTYDYEISIGSVDTSGVWVAHNTSTRTIDLNWTILYPKMIISPAISFYNPYYSNSQGVRYNNGTNQNAPSIYRKNNNAASFVFRSLPAGVVAEFHFTTEAEF